MTLAMSVRPSGDVDKITGSGDGAVTGVGTTAYFEINIKDLEVVSIQLDSPDAAANAAYTLEGTNFDTREVAYDATSTKWVDLPITVTAPTTAAGSILSVGNLGVKRLRLKVVTTATTQFRMRTFGVTC